MTGDVMEFPETFEEFAKAYSIVDRKEVYTNSSKLIPVFRVKQWLENTALRQKMVDRDALLELADDLDARATELLKVNDLDQSRQRRSARLAHATDLMAACSRIREMLGVK